MREKTASARPAATPLPRSGRMPSPAAMPADRKHTVEVLRIRQSAKLTPCHKRNGDQKVLRIMVVDKMTTHHNRNENRNGVTDISSGRRAHLLNRNEKSENETFHFQQSCYG